MSAACCKGVLSGSISLHCPCLREWIIPHQNSVLKLYGMKLYQSQNVSSEQLRQLGWPAQLPVGEVEKG